MTRYSKTILAAALAVLALLAVTPLAASASVISDCTADNSIDGKYTTSQLRDALRNMPADVDQYYGCSDLIRQQLLNNVDKKHGGKGGRTPSNAELNAASTPDQRKQAERGAAKAIARSMPTAGAVTAVEGADIERSGAKTLASSASPGTPGAMLVALVGLLLLILGELAARGSKLPAVKKFLSRSGSSDGSR